MLWSEVTNSDNLPGHVGKSRPIWGTGVLVLGKKAQLKKRDRMHNIYRRFHRLGVYLGTTIRDPFPRWHVTY